MLSLEVKNLLEGKLLVILLGLCGPPLFQLPGSHRVKGGEELDEVGVADLFLRFEVQIPKEQYPLSLGELQVKLLPQNGLQLIVVDVAVPVDV